MTSEPNLCAGIILRIIGRLELSITLELQDIYEDNGRIIKLMIDYHNNE